MADLLDVVYYRGMQKTYIWSLVVALLVVIVGIIVSVFYSSDSSSTNTTTNVNSTSTTPTVSIGKPRDDGSNTILTPSFSSLFDQPSTSTAPFPMVAFRFSAPQAGNTFVVGDSTALSIVLNDPNQSLFALGFELRKADTNAYVASSSMPSIVGSKLVPSVTWNIPHDLPAGTYYVLGFANHGPEAGVKSPVFTIIKNPLTLLATANNQYRQVGVRERGESVDVEWSTTGGSSCTVGLTNALERNLPGSGKKVIYVKPGDSIIVSCQGGGHSAMERINVTKE